MTAHEAYMRLAIEQALTAKEKGEVPVGAVIVRGQNVIASGHNLRLSQNDPTAHAEMIAIRQAAQTLGNWRLTGCNMYVTLEPCAMCAGAIAQSRLDAVFFGAYDAACGCAGSVYELCGDRRIGGRTNMIGGILEADCSRLLTGFFRER